MSIPSACTHFGQCGGCTYQTLPYEEQLKLKESQVRGLLDEAIKKGGGREYQWDGIKASPLTEAYRNKMEFTFGDEYKDGPMSLGMHKRGSFHDIVNVSECQIVDEDFRTVLSATLVFAREAGLSYYHRMRHEGFFRHLLVRKAAKTGEILIDLVTTTQNSLDLVPWADRLLDLEKKGQIKGHIAGILHTSNDSLADVVQDDGNGDSAMVRIIFMRNFWGCGLKSPRSPSSRPIPWERRCSTARCQNYIGDTKGQGGV